MKPLARNSVRLSNGMRSSLLRRFFGVCVGLQKRRDCRYYVCGTFHRKASACGTFEGASGWESTAFLCRGAKIRGCALAQSRCALAQGLSAVAQRLCPVAHRRYAAPRKGFATPQSGCAPPLCGFAGPQSRVCHLQTGLCGLAARFCGAAPRSCASSERL